MSNTSPKRFEDWEEVNCNDCQRYWDSSCDGVQKGSQKPCNSFLATRSVIIPLQVKSLQKSVKWLSVANALFAIALILHIVTSWWL